MKPYNIGPEEKIMIYMSKLAPSKDEINYCKKQIGKINEEKLFSLIIKHKVSNIVYNNIINIGIGKLFHRKWRKFLEINYQANQLRNTYISRIINDVLNEIHKNNIKCIPIKGTLLNNTIYKDKGLRICNDIDLLVSEKNLTKIIELLQSYGFQQGHIINNEFVTSNRKQNIFHRLSTHELMPFILKTDNPFVKFLIIDIQFDIFSRANNLRQTFDIDLLFDKSEKEVINNNTNCFILSPKYNLLQLCSHAFQDATRIQSIYDSKDLEIIKFLDIYEYINKYKNVIDWKEFSDELNKKNLNHIVYYVLYYVILIFGDILSNCFMDSIMPKDITFLEQYGFEESTPFKWKHSFFERLFVIDRISEVKENQQKFNEGTKYNKILNELS